MLWLASLHDDSRSATRHPLDAAGTLRASEQPVDILIANVSATGCLFLCSEQLEVEAAVSIGIAGLGRLQARIVRAEGTRYGAEFTTTVADSALSAALAKTSGAVVPFPLWAPTTVVFDEDVPDVEKLPRAARVAFASTIVIVSWVGLVGALKLLF